MILTTWDELHCCDFDDPKTRVKAQRFGIDSGTVLDINHGDIDLFFDLVSLTPRKGVEDEGVVTIVKQANNPNVRWQFARDGC